MTVVSAAFTSTFTPHYINRTQVSEINISILSGNHGNGTQVGNISVVTITLPNGYVFVLGTNITTSNMNFSNTSTTVVWSATGNESFTNNTRKDFRFNATSSSAGDGVITVTAKRADGANNVSSLTMTTNFDFSGVVVNATGGNETNVNVTLYQFSISSAGPPNEIYEKGGLTNANGSFTLTSINGSATNYLLKMVRYGPSGSGCVSSNASCNATMIGTTLPPFPAMMYFPPSGGFDFSLNGSVFYLQDAATLRLYTWGYNGSNPVQQRFGYMVIDQKIGFPIETNLMQNVTTKDIVVPSGKSFSVMFMRDFSQFPSGAFCNGTTYNDSGCPSPPITNSSLGTLNAGDIISVNQSLLITRNNLYGCINIQAGHNASPINVTSIKLKMIPFTTSSGSFIPEFDASKGDINISSTTQLNAPNATGWAVAGGVVCPNSAGAYNLSVLGSSSGISYFVEVYAKNTTLANEAGVHVGGTYLAGFANITITGNTAKNITLYKLLGVYLNDTVNKNTLNTSMMKVNIINGTGGAITNDMYVEVAVKNSKIGIGTVHFMIETLTNGTFYLPLLNNTDFAEVSVFPNDAPPMTKKLNLSSTDNNITLVVIEFHGGGDKGMRQFNSSGELEVINSSAMPIQIRFLRRGSDKIITEMNASSFNPLKALVAGLVDLELKVFATNVTMRFNNFDMFSAKQPPMFAVIDNETAVSNSQTWKFGNFVPKNVYDNVTLIIPYSASVSESGTFNISIPLLFNEDQTKTHQLTAAWNRSAGHTYTNLTDEFIAYNATRYRDYLTTAGVSCSKTDASAVCYINTTSNEIQMEIPHFSGVSPSMAVSTAASPGSSSGSGGSGGASTSEKIQVTPNLLKTGYTKDVAQNSKLSFDFSGTTHTLSVTAIQSSSIEIEVASTPQKAILTVGETKKFELTNDNNYDLRVTLNSIANNGTKASITVQSIQEEIPPTTIENIPDQIGKEESVVEQPSGVESENDKSGIIVIIGLIFVVIIVTIVIIFSYNRQKKKRYYS